MPEPGSAGVFWRPFFRVAFTLYAIGLVLWLLLGLLPTLADSIATVHRWFAELAFGGGPAAGAAMRILEANTLSGATSTSTAFLQYGFSVLNLALGLILFVKRGNALVPKLLAFALLGTAATFNAPAHRAFHITGNPWPISLLHFAFHIVSGVCYLWAVVLFPDGRSPRRLPSVPGPRWMLPGAVTAGAVLICWFSSFLDHPMFFVVFFGIVVALLGSASQLLRLADPGTPTADKQASRLLIAGLLPALALSVIWLGARLVSSWHPGQWPQSVADAVQTLFPLAFALVPIVLFAGVVHYRWWNIERILGRILVYGLIGGATGILYIVVVSAAGRLAGGGLWSSVLALSAAAALFEPLRRLADRWANRIVYGQVTSPVEAMRSLVSGMEQLSPAAGLMHVEAVTVASTRASSATLWLIDGNRLMQAAAPGTAAVALPGDDCSPKAVARALAADRCYRIAHQGELLGFFAIRVPAGTHLTAADQALIEDVAAHAGLLLLNALLGVQLTRRVDELAELSATLQTTRRRVVTAQDQERRRLERDLHDGAQQALVAAMIGLRTLRPGPDAQADIDALTEVLDTAQTWLAGLTESDHPPVLVRSGLEGALQQAARAAEMSGLHTTVAVTGTRIPTQRTDTEMVEVDRQFQAQEAVYFCCIEALQNAAKHAHASRIDVTVAADRDGLHFEVVDDGVGIDPSQQVDGAGGIPQLLQRLALCGGMLTVESALGRGTRLSGVVPLGDHAEITR